ncbi:expressed unknown protein [Seminavis robusta]|uniref:Uncharacterized protein n=1 Tax=Seminavis robusta TaxID=568900 RepID=A0A9N8HMF0_9STRA|nr:expressed unknown protein [Seminavis robusta]|eukprot:Sro994_g228990.1 n/a (419) ;mRNA; f:3942-5198
MNHNNQLQVQREETSSGVKYYYSGKWITEEEVYVEALAKEFRDGTLEIPNETSLRTFLSDKLQCRAKRITKKFENTGYRGAQSFKRNLHMSEQERKTRLKALAALEDKMHESRSLTLFCQDKANTKKKAKAQASSKDTKKKKKTASTKATGLDTVSTSDPAVSAPGAVAAPAAAAPTVALEAVPSAPVVQQGAFRRTSSPSSLSQLSMHHHQGLSRPDLAASVAASLGVARPTVTPPVQQDIAVEISNNHAAILAQISSARRATILNNEFRQQRANTIIAQQQARLQLQQQASYSQSPLLRRLQGQPSLDAGLSDLLNSQFVLNTSSGRSTLAAPARAGSLHSALLAPASSSTIGNQFVLNRTNQDSILESRALAALCSEVATTHLQHERLKRLLQASNSPTSWEDAQQGAPKRSRSF